MLRRSASLVAQNNRFHQRAQPMKETMMDAASNQVQRYPGTVTAARDPAERMTEMASLSEIFGQNRSRLRALLDLAEARLTNFAPEPTKLGEAGTGHDRPPEPTPGTLASLRCMGETTSQDLNRLDLLVTRLRDLL
jgi:hypothetical protein